MSAVLDKTTLANLLPGPARVLYAPTTVAVPTKLDDVIGLATPYTPKTGWIDAGATDDSSTYSRDLNFSDYEIEQKTGAVFSRVDSVERTMEFPFAEITPELMKIIEEGAAPVTIAAGAAASGTPAQTRQPFGSISSLTRYRWVLIAERDSSVASGEGGARGKLVGLALYSATISDDKSDWEVGKGKLVARKCTFKTYPEPTISASNSEHGSFLFETGSVIP